VAVTIVTAANAVTVVSETDVAVIENTLGLGIVAGAVYTPLASIEPQSTPVVVGSVQVTLEHVFPTMAWLHPGLTTVTVKGNVSRVPMVTKDGKIVTLIPEIIVIVAVAVLVVSACDVPVITAVGVIVAVPLVVTLGTVFGAV